MIFPKLLSLKNQILKTLRWELITIETTEFAAEANLLSSNCQTITNNKGCQKWHSKFQKTFTQQNLFRKDRDSVRVARKIKGTKEIAWRLKNSRYRLDSQADWNKKYIQMRCFWILIRQPVYFLANAHSLFSERFYSKNFFQMARACTLTSEKNNFTSQNKLEPKQTTFQTFSDKKRSSQTMTTNQQ